MSTHDKIMEHFSVYMGEQEKFEHKNVKAAASRARIALTAIVKLAKVRRAEIQKRKHTL
jgi:hypothetical protein